MGDRAQRTKETSARLLEKWGVNGTSRDSTREKGQWTLERERESEYSRYRGLVTRDNLILSG